VLKISPPALFDPRTAQPGQSAVMKYYSDYYYVVVFIVVVVSWHRPFLPGTSLEPAVIPTAQASSFTLQYFPYYV